MPIVILCWLSSRNANLLRIGCTPQIHGSFRSRSVHSNQHLTILWERKVSRTNLSLNIPLPANVKYASTLDDAVRTPKAEGNGLELHFQKSNHGFSTADSVDSGYSQNMLNQSILPYPSHFEAEHATQELSIPEEGTGADLVVTGTAKNQTVINSNNSFSSETFDLNDIVQKPNSRRADEEGDGYFEMVEQVWRMSNSSPSLSFPPASHVEEEATDTTQEDSRMSLGNEREPSQQTNQHVDSHSQSLEPINSIADHIKTPEFLASSNYEAPVSIHTDTELNKTTISHGSSDTSMSETADGLPELLASSTDDAPVFTLTDTEPNKINTDLGNDASISDSVILPDQTPSAHAQTTTMVMIESSTETPVTSKSEANPTTVLLSEIVRNSDALDVSEQTITSTDIIHDKQTISDSCDESASIAVSDTQQSSNLSNSSEQTLQYSTDEWLAELAPLAPDLTNTDTGPKANSTITFERLEKLNTKKIRKLVAAQGIDPDELTRFMKKAVKSEERQVRIGDQMLDLTMIEHKAGSDLESSPLASENPSIPLTDDRMIKSSIIETTNMLRRFETQLKEMKPLVASAATISKADLKSIVELKPALNRLESTYKGQADTVASTLNAVLKKEVEAFQSNDVKLELQIAELRNELKLLTKLISETKPKPKMFDAMYRFVARNSLGALHRALQYLHKAFGKAVKFTEPSELSDSFRLSAESFGTANSKIRELDFEYNSEAKSQNPAATTFFAKALADDQQHRDAVSSSIAQIVHELQQSPSIPSPAFLLDTFNEYRIEMDRPATPSSKFKNWWRIRYEVNNDSAVRMWKGTPPMTPPLNTRPRYTAVFVLGQLAVAQEFMSIVLKNLDEDAITAVGLDVEYSQDPNFGDSTTRPCTVQLAFGTELVAIFNIRQMAAERNIVPSQGDDYDPEVFPKALKQFLEYGVIAKVGVGILKDIHALKEFYGIKTSNVLLLDQLAKIMKLEGASLSFLSDSYDGTENPKVKPKPFRWSNKIIDNASLRYAALDGINSLLVLEKMLTVRRKDQS
ncbi:hypothetical protein BJ742DRAFT_794894 [Cladochytrium replicatum]|nr:hypothetical protein BJ742DRAFT_794894 [Cladochytrium replicatum]